MDQDTRDCSSWEHDHESCRTNGPDYAALSYDSITHGTGGAGRMGNGSGP